MNAKRKKRLAFILSAIMIVTMLPATALAEGKAAVVTSEAELNTAFESSGEIQLGNDINLTSTVEISGGEVILDLNGNALKSARTVVLKVTGSETRLIIEDSSGNNSGTIESMANSGYVLKLESGAKAELQRGTIKAEGSVTEIYPAGNTVFEMSGGIIRSGNNIWAPTSTKPGNVLFTGGKIYANGANSLNTKFYDKTTSILVREADGAFTIYEKDNPPNEFNVNYGNQFYDKLGKISDASSAIYTSYRNEAGVAYITINKSGSGTVPLLTLNSGQKLVITLNEGASIAPSEGKVIRVKEGASVVVRGSGTVADGTFVPFDSNHEIIPKTENGVTTYEPTTPMYYQVGDEQFDKLENALEAAIEGDGNISLLRNATQQTAITIPEDEEIVIDLGGHTLSMTGHLEYEDDTSGMSVVPVVLNRGNLTVKNGEIATGANAMDVIVNTGGVTVAQDAKLSNGYAMNKGRGLIVNFGGSVETAGILESAANHGVITYGGTVEITNGEISSTAATASPVTIYNRTYNTGDDSGDAAVTISGGELTSAGYVIGVNHIRSGNSSLTITDGTLNSTSKKQPAIYWPGKGVLTVGMQDAADEPEITSKGGSAIEICCGTLNIYSGIFKGGTGKTVGEKTTAGLAEDFRQSSGGSNIGDAVTVIAQRGDAYASAPLTINIAGGTFERPTNFGVRYFDCNLGTDAEQLEQDVNVSVTNGNFFGGQGSVDGSLLTESAKPFISGGIFSEPIAEYVIEGSEQAIYKYKDVDGTTTLYTVGEDSINEVIKNAGEGATLEITSGDVNITDAPAGLEVTNSGDGVVKVNGVNVGDTPVTACEHENFEWVIDKEATATEAGSKHKECTVCGYEKAAVEIPATGTSDNPQNPSQEGTEQKPQTDASSKTGDDSNILPIVALMTLAAVGIVGTAFYGRRKEQ